MSKPANNFPREGLHSTVTQKHIEALERQRSVPTTALTYTIGGSVETQVHSTINAEREAAIASGARAMKRASQNLQTGFEAAKPNLRAEYIRAQKVKAQTSKTVERARHRTPKNSI